MQIDFKLRKYTSKPQNTTFYGSSQVLSSLLGFFMESGNCTETCQRKGLTCNILMKLNKTELEKKADITCSSSSEYSKPYHPTVVEGLEPKLYDCYGVENIDPEVKCDANSPAAEKRLCDCVSEGINQWRI